MRTKSDLPQPSKSSTRDTTSKGVKTKLSDIQEGSVSINGESVGPQRPCTFDGPGDSQDTQLTTQPYEQCNRSTVQPYSRPNAARKYHQQRYRRSQQKSSSTSSATRDIPQRKASTGFSAENAGIFQPHSAETFLPQELPRMAFPQVVPKRERMNSPIRTAIQQDPVSSANCRRCTPPTYVRTTSPYDVLKAGSSRHKQVHLQLHAAANLFVGGGSVDGHIQIVFDECATRKPNFCPVTISRLCVDLIGVEEVNDDQKWIFLSLATDLFDEQHPPPFSLVQDQNPTRGVGLCWTLQPGSALIPFRIDLPLNVGPPPYESREGRIRYLLCATAQVCQQGINASVREQLNIQVVTVHDPEKALSTLASPLLAQDQLPLPRGARSYSIKLTAGLHRQTWANGSRIFVDVHVRNNSSKALRKIEIQLEKITLWYAHETAGTVEQTGAHLRPPRRRSAEVVASSTFRRSREWMGILPQTSEARTCDLEVPSGQVTVSTGRYFEVRFYINVVVKVSLFKAVAVQLPVVLIHINSLDIVPNALAQVATSINAKRGSTVPLSSDAICPPYYAGQAFDAPRRQSLDRRSDHGNGSELADLASLTREVNHSCRCRHTTPTLQHGRRRTASSPIPLRDQLQMKMGDESSFCLGAIQGAQRDECRLKQDGQSYRRPSNTSPSRPKLPKLQISTSGLDFSGSDNGIAGHVIRPRSASLPWQNQLRSHHSTSALKYRTGQAKDDGISPHVRVSSSGRIRHMRDKNKTAHSGLQQPKAVSVSKTEISSRPRGWRNVATDPLVTHAQAAHSSDALDERAAEVLPPIIHRRSNSSRRTNKVHDRAYPRHRTLPQS